MLQTTNLSFSYLNSASFDFPDIELKNNEHLLILGASGIGKTTLLHLLAGILTPNKGVITINNEVITNLNPKKLDTYRGANIGLILQNTSAIASLSVYENLEARLFFSKISNKEKVVDTILEQLDLTLVKKQKPNTLSTGQLQRLGIALGVIHRPKIILADEPTSSLDDKNCALVINLLKAQAKIANANLIIITHDQRIKNSFDNTLVL
ncbi:MAG: ATP-binding cassette domain-containing protein [Polaribacter sp.]|nr:ATP-binding cassette domain-containing protein [Polaribacter sp.]MDG1810710.1 ATP-binding cassette domain-containing protein [Polaribacter sp.]MDG1993293.1 ATP-binding cassette domain-containing protein [Polaribacter sp.]